MANVNQRDTNMRITLQDVASKANVSCSTVSRVLNGSDDRHISESTIRRVQEVAREMNYHANRAARALATGRTNTVGLWTYAVTPAYYSVVIGMVLHIVKKSGYEVQIMQSCQAANALQQTNMDLHSWPVDGIIAFDNGQHVEACLKNNLVTAPIVNMGAHCTKQTDYVGIDVYSGAADAITHLFQSGRRRIAYMVPGNAHVQSDPRENAYIDVMQRLGLQPEYIYIPEAYTNSYTGFNKSWRAHARNAVQDYIPANGSPDAIFCYNDELAIGVYRALRDLGLRMPDDIALVGCDGMEETEYFDPAISTIIQPYEAMCKRAWKFLQNRIEDSSIPQQKALLKPKLVVRGSSCRVSS